VSRVIKRVVLSRKSLFLPSWVGVYYYSQEVINLLRTVFPTLKPRNVRNVENLPTPRV